LFVEWSYEFFSFLFTCWGIRRPTHLVKVCCHPSHKKKKGTSSLTSSSFKWWIQQQHQGIFRREQSKSHFFLLYGLVLNKVLNCSHDCSCHFFTILDIATNYVMRLIQSQLRLSRDSKTLMLWWQLWSWTVVQNFGYGMRDTRDKPFFSASNFQQFPVQVHIPGNT